MSDETPHGQIPIPRTPIAEAVAFTRAGVIGVIAFSMIMNILLLTGPLYMLQIYDRVLTSQSLPTLMALSILVVGLLATFGIFDFIRTRAMARIAAGLDLKLADEAFIRTVRAGRSDKAGDGEALRDLRTVRQFIASPAATGLFDIPWLPFYIAVVFLLHPMLGWLAVAGAIVLIIIALMNENRSRGPSRKAGLAAFGEDGFVAAARGNAETIRAMGMTNDLRRRWRGLHETALDDGQSAADANGLYASTSRSLRLMLQSAILGVGAYFVIQGTLSPGALIAASIIFARALAPVDQAVAQWRTILTARQSWDRLKEVLAQVPVSERLVALRKPERSLTLTNVAVAAPGGERQIVEDVNFRVEAGEGVGIIGPSGCGKSTIVRALIGAWETSAGEIRIDGATFDQWDEAELGRHIGYLAQDVHLFDGTVAQNIARFRSNATSEEVITAAEMAGVHDLIVSLPDGYDTMIGPHGLILSAGQRQRVGLARAVFGTPFLVVLDEPNAHLDAFGEQALRHAIRALRQAGSAVIVVAHRKMAIAELNKLLLVENGKVIAFGEKEAILKQITDKAQASQGGNLRAVG